MADASERVKCPLWYQKLGLELKCPLCLNLFNRPVVLPCNHVFCEVCIPRSTKLGSDCPVCKHKFSDGDVRPTPFVETIVNIYKSSDATFSSNPIQSAASEHTKSLSTTEKNKISCDNNLGKNSVEINTYEFPHHGTDGISTGSPVLSEGTRIEFGLQEVALLPTIQSTPGRSPSISESGKDPVLSSNNKSLVNQSKRPQGDILNEAGAHVESRSCSDASYRTRKKPKTLNSVEVNADGNGTAQLKGFHSEGMGTCKLKLSSKIAKTFGASYSHVPSICVFCQSSEITDKTGPMMHYANGKEVSEDSIPKSKTIHVHKICLIWAPEAYFDGDIVKNLNPAVTRAGKLKCNRCGLKGAALGCYFTSCRKSYHYPCAANIEKCRWDIEEFLVLCPRHAHVKFPSEGLQLENHSTEKAFSPVQIESRDSNADANTSSQAKEWVFCGSALSDEDKLLMLKFARTCGAKVSKFWGQNVTHVIAATDTNGACSRTLKVLKAILNGRWVLTVDWIKESMKATSAVDEEAYEVQLDNHDCHGGPSAGRRRIMNNHPNLFHSCILHFIGYFIPAYKKDLIELVMAGGGIVKETKEEFVETLPSVDRRSIIVYCSDSAGAEDIAEELATEIARTNSVGTDFVSSEVVAHTWLLDSIAACRLQPTFI